MALSNWDTLAVTLTGELSDGEFTSPLGISVQFYKNWIYISDPKGWVPGGSYIEPIVAEVQVGYIHYKDVIIETIRGPQNGIYGYVSHGYGADMIGIIGCAVYGFTEDGTWVGVTYDSLEWLKARREDWPEKVQRVTFEKAMRINQGDLFFKKGGVGDGQPTPIGKAVRPVLLQLIDKENAQKQ